MCKYCEMVVHTGKKVNENEESELMINLPVLNEYTGVEIIQGGSEPAQYIRRYKNQYFLITELADNDGNVLLLPINNCLMCGREFGV